MPFSLQPLTLSSISTITTTLANRSSAISRLRIGDCSSSDLASYLEARTVKDLETSDDEFIHAVDDKTRESAAWTRWSRQGKGNGNGGGEEKRRDESSQVELPQGMNKLLLEAGNRAYDVNHAKVMRGRDHLVLEQLHTLPAFRRQGAARVLLLTGVEKADREGLPCFLATSLEGHTKDMYESFGFVERGRWEIDMGKYGAEGVWVYLGMVREPLENENEKE